MSTCLQARPLRVLMLNDFRVGGGAEVVVETEIRLLRAAGHDVQLLTDEDVGGRPGPLGYLHNRRAVRRVRDALAEFDPDVVHAHNVYHVFSPAVLGAVRRHRAATAQGDNRGRPRLVLTAHDFHLVCPNSALCSFHGGQRRIEDPLAWRHWTAGVLLRAARTRWDERTRLLSLAKVLQHVWAHRIRGERTAPDLVVCPGRAAAALLERGGVPVRLLPNPFTPAAAAQAEGRPPGGPRLLFAGRLEPEKGLVELLRIWPCVEDGPELDVHGDGSALPEAQATATARGLKARVRFHGRSRPEQLREAMAQADGVVMASRWPEVAPMVLLEALSVGTPIVVPDLGGMAEVVHATGAGALFRPDDAASLATAIDVVAKMSPETWTRSVARFLAEREASAHLAKLIEAYTDH